MTWAVTRSPEPESSPEYANASESASRWTGSTNCACYALWPTAWPNWPGGASLRNLPRGVPGDRLGDQPDRVRAAGARSHDHVRHSWGHRRDAADRVVRAGGTTRRSALGQRYPPR